MERWLQKIVNRQIQKQKIPEAERDVYLYGYRLLLEKSVALILTVCIAWVFHAWWEVVCFCISFIPIRIYAGGFHAKKSSTCMLISAMVVIANILIVRGMLSWDIPVFLYMVLVELPVFALLVLCSPVETQNRGIGNTEKKYFRTMVGRILIAELIVEILFSVAGFDKIVVSFAVSHLSNLGTLVFGKYQIRRSACIEGEQ